MSDREHVRIPYTVQVEFRTASSFLVAYSVNLSRGGLFLETDHEVDVGAPIALEMTVPSVGSVLLGGLVAWRRGRESADGPPGLGIEFHDVAPQLGGVIDRLISGYHGLSVLVLSGDRQDRTSLSRSIKSIMTTADVVQAADAKVAETLITSDVDLAVIDVDFDVDGGLAALRAAKAVNPPVPTLALASSRNLRDHARAAGADEVATNPPAFGELQLLLLRALGRPMSVR
jgi:uncharacterized protein (TIGR02266 family)